MPKKVKKMIKKLLKGLIRLLGPQEVARGAGAGAHGSSSFVRGPKAGRHELKTLFFHMVFVQGLHFSYEK